MSERLITFVADNLDTLTGDVDCDVGVAFLAYTLSYLPGVQQSKTERDNRLSAPTVLSRAKK